MIQVLDQHGFDGMANAIQILVNEAMKIERSEVLRAVSRVGAAPTFFRATR